MSHDAHLQPPESLKLLFKKWQKTSIQDIDTSEEVLDFSRSGTLLSDRVTTVSMSSREPLVSVYGQFLDSDISVAPELNSFRPSGFEIKALPGLIIYPSLLPDVVQGELLNRLLHRDLSTSAHKTNLDLHYDVQGMISDNAPTEDPQAKSKSFFQSNPCMVLYPKDTAVHKPITLRRMLEKKLRWMTLGGQYDWTAKAYPAEKPPDFPRDIGSLLQSIWPDVDAQAAIVNFYTPGDTLSVHRDVSEECDRGLISISIGCDGLFIVGNEDGSAHVILRLKSGDAVLMSGESRFAWHAVPKILPQTCPSALRDWPANSKHSSDEVWRGWLSNKRINLNVRQINFSL